MSLQVALTSELEHKVTFKGTVLSKTEILSYEINGSKREYFLVSVGDDSHHSQVRMYQKQKHGFVKVGKTYQFTDVVRKGGNNFWLLASSKLSQTKTLAVPQIIKDQAAAASARTNDDNMKRTIHDALIAPSTSCIQGVVVKVSPLKRRRNGELMMRHVALRDESRPKTVKLALFSDDAENAYDVGDCLEVSHVYAWTSATKKMSLGMKKCGKVQFLPKETYTVPLAFDELDSDYEDEEEEPPTVAFQITGIEQGRLYRCCKKLGCHNKKLVKDSCPVCQDPEEGVNFYVQAEVEHSGQSSTFTLFKSDLAHLTNHNLDDITTEDELFDTLCELLPIDGEGMIQANKLFVKK